MGHNLLIQNGEASMFYVGEKPWHKLGRELSNPPNSQEAIIAAGLNWEVEKIPLYAGDLHLPVKNKFATVKKDTNDIFGIVGRDYTILQNLDSFNFFDPIVQSEIATYETAGALNNGRVWILAKMNENMRVVGDDIVEKYLLLSNSHDGKKSVTVKYSPIRTVCANTLNLSLKNGTGIHIHHNTDIHQRLKEAESLLGVVKSGFNEMETKFKQMTRIQMNKERLNQYLSSVYPLPENTTDNEYAVERVKQNREWSEYFFIEGNGNKEKGFGVTGTLWNALNGVTEFEDHRKSKGTQDQRLNSLWYGEGNRIKNRAYNSAIALLN